MWRDMLLVIQSGHALYHRTEHLLLFVLLKASHTFLPRLNRSTNRGNRMRNDVRSHSPRCTNPLLPSACLAIGNLLVSAKPHKSVTTANEPRVSFRCGNNCLTCNYKTTDLLSIHLILPAKLLYLFSITLTATPNTLSTWYNVTTVTKNTKGKPNADLDRFNEHRRPVDKQTNSSKPTMPQYQNILNVTIITLLTCKLLLLNSFNLIVTAYVK